LAADQQAGKPQGKIEGTTNHKKELILNTSRMIEATAKDLRICGK